MDSYSHAFLDFFGGDWNGYCDASCSESLSKADQGFRFPEGGADDFQANCFTRIPSLVGMFAGDPRLDSIVAAAAVVTQATPEAVAWGCLAARVLQHVIFGAHPRDAVDMAVKTDLDPEQMLESRASLALLQRAASVYAECGARLKEAAQLVQVGYWGMWVYSYSEMISLL